MEQHPHDNNEQPPRQRSGRENPDITEVTITLSLAESSPDAQQETESESPTVETERTPSEPPSVYIASLADYNVGKLFGTWVDMTMPPEDIDLAIRQMLERSPVLQSEGEDYGDWAIHDYDNFGAVTVREHDDLDVLHTLAEGIAEHGDAFSAWADLNSGDHERWPLFSQAYLGHFDSLAAYGEHVWAEAGYQQRVDDALPQDLWPYVGVNGESLARDVTMSGEIATVNRPEGGIWVFRTDR